MTNGWVCGPVGISVDTRPPAPGPYVHADRVCRFGWVFAGGCWRHCWPYAHERLLCRQMVGVMGSAHFAGSPHLLGCRFGDVQFQTFLTFETFGGKKAYRGYSTRTGFPGGGCPHPYPARRAGDSRPKEPLALADGACGEDRTTPGVPLSIGPNALGDTHRQACDGNDAVPPRYTTDIHPQSGRVGRFSQSAAHA